MRYRTTHTVPPRRPGGFTLVELLVVITIIAVVAALILVGLGTVQNSARATKCLSNLRQITLANITYSNDNNGFNVSSMTDPQPPTGFNPCGTGEQWPLALPSWVNTPGGTVTETVEDHLAKGTLWTYIGENPDAYVSPQDPSGRVRSYSLSGFVGAGHVSCKRAEDLWQWPDTTDASMTDSVRNSRYQTLKYSQILQPSSTMYAITEDSALGWNRRGWVIPVAPPAGPTGLWWDLPAFWDPGRIHISYCDGSFDAPNIIYKQFQEAAQPDDSLPPNHNTFEPGTRPAFRFMVGVLLPGVIRPEVQ